MRVYVRLKVYMSMTAITVGVGLSACGSGALVNFSKPASSNDISTTSDLKPIKFASWDGAGVEGISLEPKGIKDQNSLMMALSDCRCARNLAVNIIKQSANFRGALPQALVPQIRQGIANDEMILFLGTLPPGLSSLMAALFADDNKISTEVKEKIITLTAASLRSWGGTTLGRRVPFRFDLFPSTEQKVGSIPTSVNIRSQAARWNLVMSFDSLWKGEVPLDRVDHGLQLLESSRVAAEWAYIAGIGPTGEPNGYGGLASSVADGPTKFSQPINPEKAPNDWGLFISGDYDVSFPQAAQVDLATKTRESWVATGSKSVPLLEQAMIWRAAALAFANFRPDRNPGTKRIMAEPNGMLSSGVAKLPLIWLTGVSTLFKNRYVDMTTLKIHEFAFPAPDQQQTASLKSLLAAAQALHEWRGATSEIGDLDFSPDLTNRLKTVSPQLEQPLQLLVRAILNEYTAIVPQGDDVLVSVIKNPGTRENDLSIIAETIATLGVIEQNELQSPEIRDRIMAIYQWHVRNNLMNKARIQDEDATSIIWNARAADVMSAYKESIPWAPAVREKLKQIIDGLNR